MRRSVTAVVLGALATQLGCSDSTSPAGDPGPLQLPRALTQAEADVISGANQFGFSLLSEVLEDDERPNVILSPLSASMALGMTMNGAADSTFRAMRSTLGFDQLDQEEVNQSYRGLLDLFSGLDRSVTFDVGNGIWANESFEFHQAFFDNVRQNFDAEVSSSDFQSAGTVDEINNWVSQKTKGKIERIVDQLRSEDVMVLLNAIYLDAEWTTQFDPADTKEAPFMRDDGTSVTVDMMELQDLDVLYYGNQNFSMVELPYGRGAYSMVLALPNQGSARELASSLGGSWEAAVAGLDSMEVDVLNVPRFKLSYDTYLNGALDRMGMGVALRPEADFSNMSPSGQSFCISWVRQKTFMEVDEEGTTAAAVTGVGVEATSFTGFSLNRSFVLALRERNSGTLLFLGVVGDPIAEPEDPAEAASTCG